MTIRRDRQPAPRVCVTLANMRSHGCRDVLIYGQARRCWRSSKMSADRWPDEAMFDLIEGRLVCTGCGAIGRADVRPDWSRQRRWQGGDR